MADKKKRYYKRRSVLNIHVQVSLQVVPLTDGTFAKIPDNVKEELRNILTSDLNLISKRIDRVILQRFEESKTEWEITDWVAPVFYINESN